MMNLNYQVVCNLMCVWLLISPCEVTKLSLVDDDLKYPPPPSPGCNLKEDRSSSELHYDDVHC